ncbi:MAG: hypothetical protein FWC16_12580 [Defluviitaleaceae bacterium]|nr:hypothetical protein [Defluviitaleaceae bacterium]MCL2274682.1 hypothetical protein [Defluviitaleaceae bacterium]MCL2275757.1 hypothetical protein [Defluviitaleaceae bacterium]
MKVPRDVDASTLIKCLESYGYFLFAKRVVILNHKPIKIGTLQAIVKDVCMFNKLNVVNFYKQLK